MEERLITIACMPALLIFPSLLLTPSACRSLLEKRGSAPPAPLAKIVGHNWGHAEATLETDVEIPQCGREGVPPRCAREGHITYATSFGRPSHPPRR